jgi:hypothetical protein
VNYKILEPNVVVRFVRGEVICLLTPVSVKLIEDALPTVRMIDEVPDLKRQYDAWCASRSEFNRTPARNSSDWQKHYFRGMYLNGIRAAEHRTGINVRAFRSFDSKATGAAGVRMGGGVGGATSGVIVQDGVVTPRDCRVVIDALRECAKLPGSNVIQLSERRVEMAARDMSMVETKSAMSVLREIRNMAFELLTRAFPDCKSCHVDFTLITKMGVGDRHELHADSERRSPGGEWEPNHTPWRRFTAIVYLDDEGLDFTGGSLVFPELGEIVKPRAGRMVGFQSDRHFVHQVLEITAGARHAVSVWFTDSEEYREVWPEEPEEVEQ